MVFLKAVCPSVVVLQVESMTVKLKRLVNPLVNGCFFLAFYLCVLSSLVLCHYLIEGECTEQDVQKWSSEEVSSWLRKQGFNEEADIFHG